MNLLKHDMRYVIEVYPLGILVCAVEGKGGVPMDALREVMAMCMADDVVGAGVAGALGGVFAIGSKHNIKAWEKQITDDLAGMNLSKPMQWIRGIDCGRSSMVLFYQLADTQAAIETNARLGYHYAKDTPQDSADFGRCFRMIEFCGWGDRIKEAFGINLKWDAIINRWDELSGYYQLPPHRDHLTKTLREINEAK